VDVFAIQAGSDQPLLPPEGEKLALVVSVSAPFPSEQGRSREALPTWPDVRGVSDERCKWPNTLSCGLAGKGGYDRNTGGRESAIIEGSG
jgi:hypothetical protein